MPITITRPFNADYADPYEIRITFGNGKTAILHAHDRTASDRLLIALIEHLSDLEIHH